MDGDGRSEFSGVGDNKVQIGNDDGSLYWERVFSTGAVFFSPAVFSDLDNNGRMELAVVQGRFSSDDGDMVAYLWELPETSTNAANGWPMFLHDMQRSGRLSVSDTVDTIQPTTSVTSPLDASTVSGTLDVVVLASDNFGVSRVDMYRNNVLVGTKTSTPFTFSWDTTHEENGQYSLQSKAYDASGNVGTSSLITVDVENSDPDTIAPAVSITSPLDQGTVPRKSTVTITASASDNTGVTKVEFYVNGVLECTDTTDSYTYSWKVVAKPNVVYRLQAKAYDATGNVGSSALIEVTSK